jgi:hypothetical protein
VWWPEGSRCIHLATKPLLKLAWVVELCQSFISMIPSAADFISGLFLEDQLKGVIADTLPPRHIEVERLVYNIHEMVHTSVGHI